MELPPSFIKSIISFDYLRPEAKRFAISIIKKIFDWQEFEKWRTIDLLNKILDEKIDIVLASRILKEIYYEQEDEGNEPLLSHELSVVFESLMDDYPDSSEYHLWETEVLKKQLAPINQYKTHFFGMVNNELAELLSDEV